MRNVKRWKSDAHPVLSVVFEYFLFFSVFFFFVIEYDFENSPEWSVCCQQQRKELKWKQTENELSHYFQLTLFMLNQLVNILFLREQFYLASVFFISQNLISRYIFCCIAKHEGIIIAPLTANGMFFVVVVVK